MEDPDSEEKPYMPLSGRKSTCTQYRRRQSEDEAFNLRRSLRHREHAVSGSTDSWLHRFRNSNSNRRPADHAIRREALVLKSVKRG